MTGAGAARRAALAGLLLCAVSGCGGSPAGASDGTLDVVVSSYPLQYVAEEVGGEQVTVTNLVPPGGDTHGLELAPRDVVTVGEADLVVHLPGGLQPGVDQVLDQQPPEHLVDAATVADRGADPHFWLDPLRLAELGRLVADELAALDPDSAADYAAAADRLADSLAGIDEEYAEALAPCQGATLLATHEAFGYLTDRYGLRQVGVAGLDPQVEPPPSRVRAAADAVRESGARTIFFETAAGSSVAEVLAADLGLDTAVLHPIERVLADETYPELMAANLQALRTGLVCTG
ncbi:metal ABC transporter substrate-binding protein [Blastococcus xanthinilyticus]|uniref:Zinc transport system substrate-binding protein n=1 Tax=Blastococcus xanthinilyticus TaxID=1564164 RepID=A0A5S5CYN3_9ACTN|nr:metal ABC transporter substrate-binding protein [Blastococcus xanthinilyticus]TYP87469.1 zinc transport system substrate-binding protein [Blastococcus xanthinilyticus]